MKKCSKCKEIKPLSEFFKNRSKKDGLCSECKICSYKAHREYISKNLGKYKKLVSDWSKNNKEKRNEITRKAYARKSEKEKIEFNERHLFKNKLKVTKEQIEKLKEKQNNKCAICDIEFISRDKINLDHCHTTGKVRGFLCRPCNLGLGMFKDSFDKLQKAIEYLKNPPFENLTP